MGKDWWKSKTLWANVIGLAVMLGQSFFVDVSVDWVSMELGALGIVNILLRLITGEPIKGVTITPE